MKKKDKKSKLISLNVLPKDNLIKNLLSNYNELEDFLEYGNKNNQNIPKLIYLFKQKIEDILYIEDKLISLDSIKINIVELSYLFYLSLLINEDQNIVCYSYTKDFIKRIYDSSKNDKNFIQELIIKKIIIQLINNFKKYFYPYEKELNNLYKKCENIIKNDIHFLKEYYIDIRFDEFISKGIDCIYKKIIISLIKNIKKINIEKIFDLFNQLDLNNINITNEMSEEIIKYLNKNNSNDITLSNKEDIFKEKNINLFYILLKYIYKDNYYIYNIPFLLEARKLIIRLIKSNQIKYNEINNSKLKYIIEKIVDSKYYLKNDNESIYMKLEEILKY